MREKKNLPTYAIQSWQPTGGVRFHGDANGITNAEGMVETLLDEGQAPELEIVLDGRCVEVGKVGPYEGEIEWTTFGRRRDLR